MNLQFNLALRYLSGRKLRSCLTSLAVMFGVLVIFSLNIFLPSMLESFQATMLMAANEVDLTISNQSGGTFSPDVLEVVRAVEGVRAVHGLLERPVNLPADYFDQDPATPDQISVVNLVGLDPETARGLRNYSIQAGRFLETGDEEMVVISTSLADNLGLQVGDNLALPSAQGVVNLKVAGIYLAHASLGNEQVLVTLPEAQLLLASPGLINTVEANYDTLDEARRLEIEGTIGARLGNTYRLGALGTSSDLFSNLKLAQSIFTVFGVLALFMGAFIIFNTFRTIVTERRRDIGMLRAVGASRRTVIGTILAEGLIQGGLGTLLGMTIGYLLAVVGLAAISPMLESFLHVRLGGPVISLSLVVMTIVLGVGTTLLAGLFPALSAGRVSPMEALRPTTSQVAMRRSLGASAIAGIVLLALAIIALLTGNTRIIPLGGLLFLVGLVLVAPALIRPIALAFGALLNVAFARQGTGFLAQGNLTRQPSRVAITASTTMVALAIVVAGGELAVSIDHGFMSVLRKSLGSDYLFIPPAIAVWGNNVGADANFVERLRQVDGVGTISTLRFAGAVADVEQAAPSKFQSASAAEGITVSLLGVDPAAFQEVSGLDFSSGNEDEAYAAIAGGRALIANGPFAAITGVKVGDIVPLITPQGRLEYRVAGIASDYLNAKLATGYISQVTMAQDFNKGEDVFIQLNLKPGADAAVVEPAIKAVKQDYPQFSMISGRAYYEDTRKLFSVALSSIYIVFAFLAIPSLIAMLNTLAIGVLERTREIGMLRAVGATQKQVRRMVTAEALLLAAVGTAFGLLAGLYLGYVMVLAFQAGGFPVQFYFPWGGVIATVTIGVLFGVLAALIPARQATRLEIVSALRYE